MNQVRNKLVQTNFEDVDVECWKVLKDVNFSKVAVIICIERCKVRPAGTGRE